MFSIVRRTRPEYPLRPQCLGAESSTRIAFRMQRAWVVRQRISISDIFEIRNQSVADPGNPARTCATRNGSSLACICAIPQNAIAFSRRVFERLSEHSPAAQVAPFVHATARPLKLGEPGKTSAIRKGTPTASRPSNTQECRGAEVVAVETHPPHQGQACSAQ